MIIKVECEALGVACNNALAFLPAASNVKLARVRVRPGLIEFTATDTYAAGHAWCPVKESDLTEPFEFLITREALTDLEKTARAAKKVDGQLTVNPGDGFIFKPLGGEVEPIAHFDMSEGRDDVFGMYEAIDDMLTPEQEFRTAFQPQLLQRFSKVKADKSERVADLAIDDPSKPVLVKIGTEFRGLIMPVYRDIHAELIGEEGLW